MENVDKKIIDYAKTCKNGEMTTEGFKASIDTMSFSAKAGKVALQALATVGNMFLMWGISKGIELAVKGIDNLIHSAEHCKERVDDLMSSYQSALDKANDNADCINIEFKSMILYKHKELDYMQSNSLFVYKICA